MSVSLRRVDGLVFRRTKKKIQVWKRLGIPKLEWAEALSEREERWPNPWGGGLEQRKIGWLVAGGYLGWGLSISSNLLFLRFSALALHCSHWECSACWGPRHKTVASLVWVQPEHQELLTPPVVIPVCSSVCWVCLFRLSYPCVCPEITLHVPPFLPVLHFHSYSQALHTNTSFRLLPSYHPF